MKACRRLLGVVICLALAGGATPSAGAVGASALGGCRAFEFVHAGTRWSAANVRVSGISCPTADALIKSYAKPMNCQFRFPCHFGRFVCRTSLSQGSSFHEMCTDGRRSVAWVGGYLSR